jgi:hypothetical protein
MKKVIGYCGLYCYECPAFLATQNDDNEKRKEVAAHWSSSSYPIKQEDVNCTGCLSKEGPVMSFCFECDVRKCGVKRKVRNCAHCDDYGCEVLQKLWLGSPGMKQHLDQIRAGVKEKKES